MSKEKIDKSIRESSELFRDLKHHDLAFNATMRLGATCQSRPSIRGYDRNLKPFPALSTYSFKQLSINL
jgi:hypothetical protein